jgi:hypothetical protein
MHPVDARPVAGYCSASLPRCAGDIDLNVAAVLYLLMTLYLATIIAATGWRSACGGWKTVREGTTAGCSLRCFRW